MTIREQLDRILKFYERGVITTGELEGAICKCCKEFPADVGEGLDAMIRLREREVIDGSTLCAGIVSFLGFFPEQREQVLEVLSTHPHSGVRELGPWFRSYIRTGELSRDFDHVRKTSALQPGTRLMLSGGYTSWWLNGRQYYKATFIAFAGCRLGRRPLAFIELDETIHMKDGIGREHKGRSAVLNDIFGPVINPNVAPSLAWGREGTVIVHIVDALPQDVEAFSACDAVFTSSFETHASYRIIEENVPSGAGSLWSIAKELATAIDALDDECTAAMAAQSIRDLARGAPALLLTVIPALIQRLRPDESMGAPVRSLLIALGDPALRVLIANLSCEEPRLRREAASTIAGFGPAAREALPELETLLQGPRVGPGASSHGDLEN
jgi:hypothetical protein